MYMVCMLWSLMLNFRTYRLCVQAFNLPVVQMFYMYFEQYLTLILRRSRTGTVWFYTSTSNKRAA